MSGLTEQARIFINRFQGGFPIVERPFHRVAAKLDMTEAALIQMVERLLEQGVLSRFGPLYDPARLGGAVTLAALSVPATEFERVAALVNACTQVAHNYRRDHALNMWFVVAAHDLQGVADCLASIAERTGLPVYDFPKLREFYLGLRLKLGKGGWVDTLSVEPRVLSADNVETTLDWNVVTATQAGLPLVPEPYAAVGEQIGIGGEQVMQQLRRMLDTGMLRRIGAVPHHYRLGLRGNGMSVWDVPDELAGELGERIGALDFVSHAYLRPRHPGVWNYNLFAMVHGCDRGEVMEKAEQIRRLLGEHLREHDVLFSSAVLKKTGLRLAA